MAVETLPRRHRDAVAQADIVPHPLSPKVEVAIPQSHLLRYRRLLVDLEGWRECLIQHRDRTRRHLDLSRGKLGIERLIGAPLDRAFHAHDKLRAQPLRQVQQGLIVAADDLGDAVAVPYVEKDQRPKVSNLVNPTHQRDVDADVAGAELAACVGSGEEVSSV